MAGTRPSRWLGLELSDVDANMLEAGLLVAAQKHKSERYARVVGGEKHAEVASFIVALSKAAEV